MNMARESRAELREELRRLAFGLGRRNSLPITGKAVALMTTRSLTGDIWGTYDDSTVVFYSLGSSRVRVRVREDIGERIESSIDGPSSA